MDTPAAVIKALGDKNVKGRALLSHAGAVAKTAPNETLVLFSEDVESLARTDRLLESLLRSARTAGEPAIDTKQLCKGLAPAMHDAFEVDLERRLTERRMPVGIAALPGEPAIFFFVADAIFSSSTASAPVTQVASRQVSLTLESFAARFDTAFAALDRRSGGRNYVTLHALRDALADVPRGTFDAELAILRRQRRYTLDPSDGRHLRMTEAEREAGIMEAGNLLVYVARRSDS